MDIGYGRLALSEDSSKLDWLKQELQEVGAERESIFVEQTSVAGPYEQRDAAISRCHKGDTLIVMTPIRLAPTLPELLAVVYQLEKKGAALHIRALGISTGTPPGETMLHTMQIISAFEREAARERQLEGMAKARAAGKSHGRAATDSEKVRQALDLAREGVTRQDIAKRLGVGVATVYRILRREKSNLPGDQDGPPK
jgi:DNA invertase Pin-like site-specific DNA recombinase